MMNIIIYVRIYVSLMEFRLEMNATCEIIRNNNLLLLLFIVCLANMYVILLLLASTTSVITVLIRV